MLSESFYSAWHSAADTLPHVLSCNKSLSSDSSLQNLERLCCLAHCAQTPADYHASHTCGDEFWWGFFFSQTHPPTNWFWFIGNFWFCSLFLFYMKINEKCRFGDGRSFCICNLTATQRRNTGLPLEPKFASSVVYYILGFITFTLGWHCTQLDCPPFKFPMLSDPSTFFISYY